MRYVRDHILFILIVGGTASLLLFWRLGDTHLTNWDEAWYADVSRHMAETGDLLTPVWNGQPFFEKPPMYFWGSSVSYRVFPDEEFAARFFSAASGMGVVVLVYFLGRTIAGSNMAIAASIVMSSTIFFLFRSRTGNIDTLFTFWILLEILLFYTGILLRKRRLFWALGAVSACAVLTKGLTGLVFPAIGAVYLFIEGKEGGSVLQWMLEGVLLGVILLGSWVGLSYSRDGWGYISGILLHQGEKLGRSGLDFSNFSLEYIHHMKSGMKLWFIALIPSFFYSAFSWRRTHWLLISVFFTLWFLGLSLVESKNSWLILPLYPLASIMIGFSIVDSARKWSRAAVSYILIFCFFAGMLQVYRYSHEFIVPDIAGDEARVALYAKEAVPSTGTLYLTHYYYPTTAYYSRRVTNAVYAEHDNTGWWVQRKDAWPTILEKEHVYIVTTPDDVKSLERYFSLYEFDILYESGDKMLIQKKGVSNDDEIQE